MKMPKNMSNKNPSVRDNIASFSPLSIGVQPIISITNEEITTMGISRVIIVRWITMGRTIAVIPIIANMLKMLEPMTLPIAIPEFPPIADTPEITNSGVEVPNATTVSPTTRSEMPKRRANAEAPSVNALAPISITTNPATRYTKSKIIIKLYYLNG